MSTGIHLGNGKEIHEWMQANQAEHSDMKLYNMEDFMASIPEEDNKTVPEDGNYYGVEHTIFSPEGSPILSVARVYVAHSAKEALQQYLFGCASQLTGSGIETVFTKMWGNFSYQMQEIGVMLLPETEYLVH